ncbi:MAG: hypothetical protein NZ551_08710 [Microscillaceae bacterium]|nr:hypothetical protein [Microscillaceae bacterium]MDW8461281.1 hypothetical protein [Cytophagales bacterium]
MKKLVFLFCCLLITLLTSCLTAEQKEYIFELNGKGGGNLTIRYIGILSSQQKDDTESPAEKDYQELVENYLNGSRIQEDFPNAKIVSKRLYEENGKLNGEVIISFDKLEQVKVYQYDKNSPYMFNLALFSDEKVQESNGKQGPDFMPTIFWDKKLKKLTLKTKIAEQSESNVSLLKFYKKDK